MDAVAALREQLAYAHSFIEQCLEGLSDEQAHRLALAQGPTIAEGYAEGLVAERRAIQGLRALAPADSPPSRQPDLAGVADVADPDPRTDDLATLRRYAQAAYTASDEYLARLHADDLDREVNVGRWQGITLNWLLFARLISPISRRAGEIQAIRRAHGAGGGPGDP